MASLATLQTPGSWHLITLSLATGTTFFHSFIGGPIQYRNLPRMQFGYIQSKIFPVYFSFQTVAAGVLYYTNPVDSPLAIWIGLIAGSLGNLALVGPWTTSLMKTRHELEKSTGTKYTDETVSPEMKALNKKFGIAHGVSTLLNLGYLVAAITQILYIADSLPLTRD